MSSVGLWVAFGPGSKFWLCYGLDSVGSVIWWVGLGRRNWTHGQLWSNLHPVPYSSVFNFSAYLKHILHNCDIMSFSTAVVTKSVCSLVSMQYSLSQIKNYMNHNKVIDWLIDNYCFFRNPLTATLNKWFFNSFAFPVLFQTPRCTALP